MYSNLRMLQHVQGDVGTAGNLCDWVVRQSTYLFVGHSCLIAFKSTPFMPIASSTITTHAKPQSQL